MPPLDRRRVLVTTATLAGTTLLAGCSGVFGGSGGDAGSASRLRVTNERESTLDARLQMTKTDPGTVVFDEDVSLDPGASETFAPGLEPGVIYRVIVSAGQERLDGEVTYRRGSRVEVSVTPESVDVSRTEV